MKSLLKVIGGLALAITLVSPILFATDQLSETTLKTLMLIGAVAWFSVAPKLMAPR